MWLIRYNFGTPSEVVFEFGANHDILKESQEVVAEYSGKGKGNGCRYHVAIPQPIVSLTLADLNDISIRAAQSALCKAVRIESRNISYRRLNVHYFEWFPNPASLEIA